ncbi:MAG: calcium-binding protein [Candidatus Omnitrophica bacterium]|nr:calcium-binding protein [Candidatus Omnitrophota bacterium]
MPSVNIYTLDSDQDGLTDAYEIQYHTDLLREDTDGDGYEDGWEVKNFQNPVAPE